MESSLKYHQGSVKACIVHDKKRIFFNTRVRIDRKLLDSKMFVKKEVIPHWQKLNKQILSKKDELDSAILKDLNTNGNVDLDRVKLILSGKDVIQASVEIDKGEVLIGDVLKTFRETQPKMDRGLIWRYQLLQNKFDESNQVCSKVTPKYVHSIIETFIGASNANTATTRYKNFKRFYKWAKEDEKYPLPNFDWKRHRPSGFKPDFVYLDDEKIEQLYNYVPSSVFLGTIKDIFLALIYTGMRYSDYESLTPQECSNGFIEKTAQKTKVRFRVPIHPRINHIIETHPVCAGQVFNRGVKELGKEMSKQFPAWSSIVRFQTDADKFEMLPFHDLLCSSVGRHTFAVRCLLAGIPHNVIINFCGWRGPQLLFYYGSHLQVSTTDYMNKLK